jgi:hypothetical protein
MRRSLPTTRGSARTPPVLIRSVPTVLAASPTHPPGIDHRHTHCRTGPRRHQVHFVTTDRGISSMAQVWARGELNPHVLTDTRT